MTKVDMTSWSNLNLR